MRFTKKAPSPRRIKSNRKPHSWFIVGGYDPALDGELRRYAVKCFRCGEHRRVSASYSSFVAACRSGCARDGFTGRYENGDMVRVPPDRPGSSVRLDYFANYLPDGKAATTNAGGGTFIVNVADLTPYLPE